MSRDALVVGISSYKNLPSLCAPAHDAEDIARCFESFGECRVVRLPEAIHDNKPVVSPQAVVTAKMLEDALIRLFKPSGKNIPHMAIFYFSGHGLQRNAGIQEGYLATSDTNPAMGNYGLSLYWLRRLLQESPVRQRVVILDCCNSGEFFNILEADPGAKAGTDRLFMAASREYEEAYESLTGSHSVFTQALLSGLNPYKIKGNIVNGHYLIDAVNTQLKGELQQPLFESSGTEIVLTRAGSKEIKSDLGEVTALERLRQMRYKYCPFRGLAPFEAAHGDFFFGREGLTQTLVQMVQSSRMTVLAGASGIGKTSLLQAGLIHTLNQQNQIPHAPQWDIRYVCLGHDPLKQLAEAFVDPTVTGLRRAEQIRTAESFFQHGAQGITQLVQGSLTNLGSTAEQRILLVIDQFETLFAPAAFDDMEAQRQAVLDGLVAVVNKPHVPIHIVLGMRSQHLQDCEAYPEFHTLVARHCLVVPAMTYDQLKATIIGPLDRVGLQYDANLIYTLLLDVVGSPGELPLLQLALSILWHHREQEAANHVPPRLTLETYVKLGGLRQILRQHATEVFDSLPTVEKPIAQRILLSLCEFHEGSAPSRRQVDLAEFVTQTLAVEQVTATLNRLLAARLVVVDADADSLVPQTASQGLQQVPAWSGEATPDYRGESRVSALSQLFQQQQSLTVGFSQSTPHFEISHESLLRNWPVLDGWLQEHRPRMKLQRSIEAAALEWQQQQRPHHPDYLLSQARLADAIAFQQDQGEHLSALAHEYLQFCSRQARSVKRKRYLTRLLIPLSMATGMLAAYGHSNMTHPLSNQGAGASTAPAQSAPFYEKAESQATTRPPGSEKAEAGPIATASSDHVARDQSALASFWPGSGRQQAGPLNLSLTAAMKHSQVGITSWQQSLQNLPVSPNLNYGLEAGGQPSLTGVNGLLQPVAQWISPSDPQVMIQVWCTRNNSEPVCFPTSMSRSSAPDWAAQGISPQP